LALSERSTKFETMGILRWTIFYIFFDQKLIWLLVEYMFIVVTHFISAPAARKLLIVIF